MAGKLHIRVMYLCVALLTAIILLAVSKEGEAKPVLCPKPVHVGFVTSAQSCTNLCRKKFGALYYSTVVTNKKSGVFGLERFSLRSWLCGCKVMKRKGKKCPSDSDSSGSDSSDSDGSSSSGSSSSDSDCY